MTSIFCSNCKTKLEEAPQTPVESRIPCPSCGSTKRFFSQTLEGTVKLHSLLSYKGKHAGKGGWFIKGVIGADLFRKLGKWMRLERVIDRDKNHYKEIVTDPTTNEIIRQCEEPLSKHQGHGSAKNNKPSESD